jgi:glucose 1-dehydrogenase
MKSVAVYPRLREVRLIECDEPEITEPTEAKLRILEVGICGTDKEICRFEYGTPPEGSEYLILGHESLGEVVAVGSAVNNLRVGDLVVTMVRRPCHHRHCPPCRSGHQDFCRTGDFTERGIKGLHGFMAEYVVDDSRYMYPVPADLRDVGVLVEPGTIAAKALFQTVSILRRLPWFDRVSLQGPHDRTYKALVLGAGAVGLLGAMALRYNGFDTYVYDRALAPNPKSQLVESLGATYVAEESRRRFAHLVGEVDLVYEATGASRLAFQAMSVLGPNSIFIFTGVPGQKPPSDVDTDSIMRNAVLKNQVILGTVNAGPEAFAATIAAFSAFQGRWPGVAESLITRRYPLKDFRELLIGDTPLDIKSVLTLR